ncbi:hypothetical protein V8F06_013029, partial [Rhypophila decipiens]
HVSLILGLVQVFKRRAVCLIFTIARGVRCSFHPIARPCPLPGPTPRKDHCCRRSEGTEEGQGPLVHLLIRGHSCKGLCHRSRFSNFAIQSVRCSSSASPFRYTQKPDFDFGADKRSPSKLCLYICSSPL